MVEQLERNRQVLREEQKKEGNGGSHDYNELYLNKKQSKQKISNKSLNQSTVLMRLKSWINNQMVIYTFTIFTIL